MTKLRMPDPLNAQPTYPPSVMPMTPFHDRCPEVTDGEMLVLHIKEPGLSLPPGEYGFFEWYCDDPSCDCLRTVLRVISPQQPGRVLATINYGWESPAFYTQWMHGDAQAGLEITSACLDPINPQSELADALLDGFREHVRREATYPQQLQRHYELFKSTQSAAPTQAVERPPVPAMSIDEILRQLRDVPRQTEFAPYEAALRAASAQRETIIPELLAAIERVTANPAPYLRRDNVDYSHSFAIYLLAQFREPRARDAFLRFFSLPGEQALDLTGDTVTERGAAVLASVCGGDPAPLLRLALDEAVNEFVRGQAIDALLVQTGWGERPRAAVIADLRRLFETLPKPGDPYVWAELICAVLDFNALELLPEVRRAFAEDLVDEGVIGLEDVDPEVARGPQRFPQPNAEERFRLFLERNAPIDAVAECSGWLCFRDDQDDDDWDALDDEAEEGPLAGLDTPWEPPPLQPPPVPFVAPPKVGRNEPCPCGSGRKYKKCCGKN